ncbi:MAG: PfkB family carbohydrate kinase [Planctomycetota bacterium]
MDNADHARRRLTVVGLGEVVWDYYPDDRGRRPGGAPANVVFHVTQCGHRGVVASAVGDDADGEELVDYLAARGVDTAAVRRSATRPTARVDVHTDGGGPGYTIHDDTAWDGLAWDDEWAATFSRADAVCFGTLAQRHATTRDFVGRALRSVPDRCLKVFDINLRPPWWADDVVVASFDACDVLKLSSEEVEAVGEVFGVPAGTPDRLADELGRRSGKTIAVTLGGEGAVLKRGEEVTFEPAAPADVVDTVGAGDAFTAGLTLGLLDGLSTRDVLRFANGLGGVVASCPGAMPDYADRLAGLRARLGLAPPG